MTKSKKLGFALIISSSATLAVAVFSSANLLNFGNLKMTAAYEGPVGEISSVSFYENSAVAATYGTGTGAFSNYKANQTVSLSGADWIISAASYGEDNPTHLTQTAGYNTLFFSSVFDATIANTYSLYSGSLTEDGIYKDHLSDFTQMSSYSPFTYNMAIMSTTTFTDVTDISFFWHYATASDGSGTYSSSSMGVIPMLKLKDTSSWVLPYYGAVSYSAGSIYYKDSTSEVQVNATSQIDTIGSVDYGRFYDGCYIYNDNMFNNLGGKEFYLGFVVYGTNQYAMDMQIDGIIVNRHQSAMKFMNSLNDKTICSGGTITDKNIIKCFELFDKAFATGSISGGSDLSELADYSIDSSYTNLREGNYYDQYRFLESKLA